MLALANARVGLTRACAVARRVSRLPRGVHGQKNVMSWTGGACCGSASTRVSGAVTAWTTRGARGTSVVASTRSWARSGEVWGRDGRARGTAAEAGASAADADASASGTGGNVERPEEAVGARGNWGESSGRARTATRVSESIEGEVFRPRERLKTNADFDRVKRDGRTYNGAHLRIKAVDNASYEGATCTRIGIVVPKKRVRRAVDRNLIKRRVRHVFRTNKDKWPPRVDIIVFAGDTTLEAGFEGVRDDMFAWSLDYVARAEQSQRRRAHGDAKRRRGEKFGAPTAAVESPPARPRAAARPPTPSENPSL